MCKRKISIFMLYMLFCLLTFGQETQKISLKILDKNTDKPLQGAHVCLGKKCVATNTEGVFTIKGNSSKKQILIITHLGYVSFIEEVHLDVIPEKIYLVPKNNALEEVLVPVDNKELLLPKSSQSKIAITTDFLEKNRANSLMETLKTLPGVSTISIGSGQSKPVIRGLGFNRVVVAENGIKHEAQQWGADHGLEIDQYNTEKIEITKGASSLLYGSDAIAGVVAIKTNKIPKPNTFLGEITLNNESNNNGIGASIGIKKRYTNLYYKIRGTYQSFGDFKVPTNRIYYENYIFNLHKNYLRNTAGFNRNISVSMGYTNNSFSNEIIVSNVNSKNGFFANAHGLEVRVSKIDYDSNNRDIDLPYHKVNHFKIINNSKINFSNNTLTIGVGFQNNKREEHSEPIEHGYMPKPISTKERVFTKNTYSLNVKNNFHSFENHKLIAGLNIEYQNNDIDGWGFLIPAYNRFTAGIFLYNQYKISNKIYAEGGLRYDYGAVNTKDYFEWFYTPVTKSNGLITQEKLQRAKKQNLTFGSYSASFGVSYIRNKTSYKVNFGKSFRIPLANELASNGVNYHMYRYEEGNLNLDPESSYQVDGELNYNTSLIDITVSPFINYFDNYIYLNPSSDYYNTLQKYKFTQSKVFRYGGELFINFKPIESLAISTSLEYVKAKQLNGSKKNFTLPFSPPLSSVVSAKYNIKSSNFFKNTNVFADFRITATQNDIVPPEKTTKGYSLLNLGVYTTMPVFSKKYPLKLQFKLNNILDKKVFNHTSFYRLIEVPEPGRNFLINLIQTF